LRQLTSLTLEYKFPVGYNDFSFCAQIQFLSLKQSPPAYHDPPTFFPSFPVFQGQEIHLRLFSLASWNGECFNDLKKCVLESCKDLIRFPAAPVAREIALVYCSDLISLQEELPFLTRLKVLACADFQTLFLYPRLREVNLQSDFNGSKLLSHVKSLELHSSEGIPNIIPFKNIRKLTIHSCVIPSLEGLAGTASYQEDKRIICLQSRVPSNVPADFHFNCHHIYQLDLVGIQIESLEGVVNIHHLTVRSSWLRTTKGLRNITGSLTLPDARALKSIERVKNIPIVKITWATFLTKFEGLGNHQELHMLRIPKFEKFLNQFRERRAQSELFSSIKHLFMETKHSKNVKQIW
jgi:hypothetical protein